MAGPLMFAVYAIYTSAMGNLFYLDTTKAFTSVFIITLLTGLVLMLLQTILMTVASLGAYDWV